MALAGPSWAGVRAALWRRAAFALALTWWCVNHVLSLRLRFSVLVFVLLWRCVDHALILRQRLGFSSRLALIRALSHSRFCGSASCLHSPFCGDGSWLRQPPGGSVSGGDLVSLQQAIDFASGLACAQGTSTSSLAAVAISASLAGSTPAVPSVRTGAVITTGNAPPRRSCVSKLEGSTFPYLRSRRQQVREGQGFQRMLVSRPLLVALPLPPADLCHALQAVSRVRGGDLR